MKIYIDCFKEENEFVETLKIRLIGIRQDIEIIDNRGLEEKVIEKHIESENVIVTMKESDIIIPIVTSDYLSKNEKEIDDYLVRLSEQKDKYLIPVIYSSSNWSSINWIVKSNIIPEDGIPFTVLNENQKEDAINRLTQTVNNIILSKKKEYAKPEPKKAKSTKKNNLVFISHAHKDADFAELLKLHLEKYNISGWIDNERLKVGQDWREEIDTSIESSLAIIVVMTPEARKSEYVTYEWAYAWGKSKKIFPIMLEQTPLHPRLESLQYLDFTNRVSRPWNSLIKSITSLIK